MRFLLILLLALPLFAQQTDLVGLTEFPVPVWPANGVVPESMKENYVFVDLPKNEYIVAYPENLGTDAFARDPGKMKINRYPLLRNVAPALSVAITPAGGTRLKYSYGIDNAPAAKQSVDTLILALPGTVTNETVKQPDGWFGVIQKDRKFKLRNPEFIPNGAAVIWSFQKLDQMIAPGSSKKGFELESDLRPGFTVAFARKSESIDVKITTHGNVPKEVKEQMDQVLQIEYNSRTVLTLGPKFDKSADDHKIAEDYIQGIFLLTRTGALDLNSDFVRNTLSELTAVKPGASASSVVKLTTPAKSATESDLVAALKTSFRLK